MDQSIKKAFNSNNTCKRTNKTEAGFSDEQMEQIWLGRECGLTAEEIELYAKPEYDAKQMEQIRFGLEEFLDAEEIELYAKPEYDAELMEQMRITLRDGLTVEGFEMLYAKPEYSAKQMERIRTDLVLNWFNYKEDGSHI